MESQPQQPSPPPALQASSDSEERTWAMVCHLAALAGIIGALVAWLILRERSRFADEQGKESVNFQILVTAGLFGLAFLFAGMIFLLPLWPLISLAWFAWVCFDLAMIVLGAVKANNGEKFRYPFSLRLIK